MPCLEMLVFWKEYGDKSPCKELGGRFWSRQESSQTFIWLRIGYLLRRCDGCEAVLLGIEQQVLRANQYKENHSRTQQQVEAEVRKRILFPCSRGSLFVSLSYYSCCRLNNQTSTNRLWLGAGVEMSVTL